MKFDGLLRKTITKRLNNKYRTIDKRYGEEFTKILKELDDQVLRKSPYANIRVNSQIKLINSLYHIWGYPSDELHSKIIEEFNKIKEFSPKENEIWNIRKNYWNKLENYTKKEIDKIKPKVGIPKKGIIFMLLGYLFTKQLSFLGVILEYLFELSKLLIKPILVHYNKSLVYHKFGVDAIQKNIEVNRRLKKISSEIIHLSMTDNSYLVRSNSSI